MQQLLQMALGDEPLAFGTETAVLFGEGFLGPAQVRYHSVGPLHIVLITACWCRPGACANFCGRDPCAESRQIRPSGLPAAALRV